MKITETSKSSLEVFLPDTRGVSISRWGKGNLKIGPSVITYSKPALTTCPGATPWCKENCYAKRIGLPVLHVHLRNEAAGVQVPDLPEGTKLVRIHVAGDFDSISYIARWTAIAMSNLGVRFWAYTRSWRVAAFLPHLEALRALPNVQLFASMDESTTETPPPGWRCAWVEGDKRAVGLVCPEELGRVNNCESCTFCFHVSGRDVVFKRH